MWEMFDDEIECDECGGPGPPPKFLVPPPPRPPYMQEIIKCSDNDINNWDISDNMCEAIPILDASYHSSPSLQTSAMIAVFSLLLVLVVLISSLFVWKHKRKVQNFLPCKTPTRGGHLSGGVPGAHSVTYEDPDAHLGHRPLVMRHHHNVEMIHPKSIHYPSGYPMTRSPPLFVCSSPGPDPYRSNDNVYEELGPGRDSDNESDPPLHSDDDFAEDELSLPGERSFNKSSSDTTTTTTTAPVATIYHERMSSGNVPERNSLISTSSSTTNNDQRNGLLSGMLRQATGYGLSMGRKIHHSSSSSNSNKNNRKTGTYSADELNTSSEQTGSDVVPTVYDDRNLISLAYNSSNNSNNNNSFSASGNNRYATSTPGLALAESEVERRNRINNQLHHPPVVSTIFRERINYNAARFPQPYYTHHNILTNQIQHRSRTNPRSVDRRRIGVPIDHEPSYGYAEPVFHEGLVYDACLAHPNSNTLRPHPYPYIMPEYTSYRTLSSTGHHHLPQHLQQPKDLAQSQQSQPHQQLQQLLYSRDSSFGSDSGYSHHTQASSGRSVVVSSSASGGSSAGRLSNSLSKNGDDNKLRLSFSWNRRPNKRPNSTNNNLNSGNNNNSANNNSSNASTTINKSYENS